MARSKTGHIDHLDALYDGDTKLLRQLDCRGLFTTAARRARLPEYIIDELRGDTPKNVQDVYNQGSANHADVNLIATQIMKDCGQVPEVVVERIKLPD